MTFEHERYKVGLLIISDRASVDSSYDRSSSIMHEWIQENLVGGKVVCHSIVPDDVATIRQTITQWIEEHDLNLLLTSGGTGFTPRDKTPEAVGPLLDREAPGIVSLIMHKSIDITEFAALSRPVAGLIGKCFLLTLPGSPKAVAENLGIVKKVLPHALQLASGTELQRHPVSQSSSSTGKDVKQSTSDVKCMCSRTDDISTTEVGSRPRVSKYPMISCDEAWNVIEKVAEPMPIENWQISQFSGGDLQFSVLTQYVWAQVNVPAFNVSFVDGYAIKLSADSSKFRVAKVSTAGIKNSIDIVNYDLREGECVRVNTGSVLPVNSDAVVMIENTQVIEYDHADESKELVIEIKDSSDIKLGENIRYQGSDLKMGQLLFPAGHVFSSTGEDLALLISSQVQTVSIYKKVRIGIMSTGNELFDYKEMNSATTQGTDRIFDSNRPALLQLLQNLGVYCECIDFGIVKDDRQVLSSSISSALNNCDILITTGGVSMGEHDFIKPILESDLNSTIHFGRLFMKPGKPTTFATVERDGAKKYIFALPGNPVSAQVTCLLFVLPLVKLLNGRCDWKHEMRKVTLNEDMKLDPRPEFVRVRTELQEKIGNGIAIYEYIATSTGKQTSSRIASLVGFDALLQLPGSTQNFSALKSGSQVDALLIK